MDNASGYEITLEGYGTYMISADKTSYNLPLMSEGSYNVSVKALGYGEYSDSEATVTEYAATGEAGEPGADGADGKSAYELAVENGFEGTLEEWLESLKGEAGADGTSGCGSVAGVGTTIAFVSIALAGIIAALIIGKRSKNNK